MAGSNFLKLKDIFIHNRSPINLLQGLACQGGIFKQGATYVSDSAVSDQPFLVHHLLQTLHHPGLSQPTPHHHSLLLLPHIPPGNTAGPSACNHKTFLASRDQLITFPTSPTDMTVASYKVDPLNTYSLTDFFDISASNWWGWLTPTLELIDLKKQWMTMLGFTFGASSSLTLTGLTRPSQGPPHKTALIVLIWTEGGLGGKLTHSEGREVVGGSRWLERKT